MGSERGYDYDVRQRLRDDTRNYLRARSEWHNMMRTARSKGLSYREIAELADVSPSTVKRMVG